MENWIVPLAIVVGSVIIALAIDRLNKNREEIDSKRTESQEKLAQLNTVSNIAGLLIGGALSNPRYIETIEQLSDQRVGAILPILERSPEKEERIKEAEGQFNNYSIFHYKGRRKFIELAWNIYDEISSEQKKRI